MLPKDEELRNKVLYNALRDCNPKIRAYKKYSIAYCDKMYVIIDVNKYVYIVKPIVIKITKPGIMESLRGLNLPITVFRAPMVFGSFGATILPQVSGARPIRRHNVHGWRVYFFKGPFKLQDHQRRWVGGECIGLFAYAAEWDALSPEEAIRKLIGLLKRIEQRVSEEDYLW